MGHKFYIDMAVDVHPQDMQQHTHAGLAALASHAMPRYCKGYGLGRASSRKDSILLERLAAIRVTQGPALLCQL